MNALLVVFAKVLEKHLEITIAADARRQYIDGDEFSGVASKFSDLSSTLRLSYKRLESNRVANKRRMHLVKRLCFLSSMGTVSKCT